jgi:hypothetical protein
MVEGVNAMREMWREAGNFARGDSFSFMIYDFRFMIAAFNRKS